MKNNHGIRTIHRNGSVEHIALCQHPECHRDALPRLTDKTNLLPEVQSILDLMSRRIAGLEESMAKSESEFKATIEQVKAGHSEALKDALVELADRDHDRLSSIAGLELKLAASNARIAQVEQVTLWSLVRRCFSR